MYNEFKPGGELLLITGEGKDEVVSKLTYRITGGKIYYKGRSTNNEEFILHYTLKGDTLQLRSENQIGNYIRLK